MNYLELKKQLIQQSAKILHPIGGEFELTSRCNLKCQMCYVREDKPTQDLSTASWINIFKEAYQHGLLFALLTGGEVLLRDDFLTLYNTLYDMGVRIAIYTNGTLINDSIINAFRKRPPEFIVITLYGSSNEVYAKVTQVSNGFTLVDKAIDLLKQSKLNVVLRTIAIKEIYMDLDNIIQYTKDKNIPMQYSLYVGPRRNNCNSELSFRLTPAELIEYEQKFIDHFGTINNQEFNNSLNGFNCVALKSAYFVNFLGMMQPCAMLMTPSMSLIDNNFLDVWQLLGQQINQFAKCHLCVNCKYNQYCLQCPAKLYLEGDNTKCSDYLREVALLRTEIFDEKI